LKTETIDSPVIELIDNALININDKVAILEQKNSNLESRVSVLDGTILDLQNQISTLENRLNRLIGNFMVPF
jgi:chaperonin cofactor prefoldin